MFCIWQGYGLRYLLESLEKRQSHPYVWNSDPGCQRYKRHSFIREANTHCASLHTAVGKVQESYGILVGLSIVNVMIRIRSTWALARIDLPNLSPRRYKHSPSHHSNSRIMSLARDSPNSSDTPSHSLLIPESKDGFFGYTEEKSLQHVCRYISLYESRLCCWLYVDWRKAMGS